MVIARTIRHKGATTTVVANGEVMFMPGGQVHGWTRRFSNRIQRFTEAYAPSNRRPRWAHYGAPLKKTIVSAPPRFRNYARGPKIYAGVGSSAIYSAFVDQGTGVYAGNGPYEGRILPPWTRGSPSLYEATWRVPSGTGENTSWREVGPVMIKGQKGQFYFERGLLRGFQSMRMRSFQVPSDPKISQASDAAASIIEGVLSNTKDNPLFLPQLKEWRMWRQEAWNRKGWLGPDQFVRPPRRKVRRFTKTEPQRRASNAARQAKWREAHGDKVAEYNQKRRAERAAKSREKNAVSPFEAAKMAERIRVGQIATSRYPAPTYQVGDPRFVDGRWEFPVSGPGLPSDFVVQGKQIKER